MNEQKVQQEIDNIISEVRGKGWNLTRTTQKALRELDDLGLTEYVGKYARQDVKGAEIINAVIAAAKDAGDGYADTTTSKPSALYLVLHETATTQDTTEYQAIVESDVDGQSSQYFWTLDEATDWIKSEMSGVDIDNSHETDPAKLFEMIGEWENFDGESFAMSGYVIAI